MCMDANANADFDARVVNLAVDVEQISVGRRLS